MSFETDLSDLLAAKYISSPQELSAPAFYLRDDRIEGDNTNPPALPLITWEITNRHRQYHVDDTSSLKTNTVEFNCFAATALAAQQLGAQVLALLDGKLNTTIGTTRLERGVTMADYDDYEEASQSFYRFISLNIGYR